MATQRLKGRGVLTQQPPSALNTFKRDYRAKQLVSGANTSIAFVAGTERYWYVVEDSAQGVVRRYSLDGTYIDNVTNITPTNTVTGIYAHQNRVLVTSLTTAPVINVHVVFDSSPTAMAVTIGLGTPATSILTTRGAEPRWNSDGRAFGFIGVKSGNGQQLCVAVGVDSTDGSITAAVTGTQGSSADCSYWAFSPLGDYVAYLGDVVTNGTFILATRSISDSLGSQVVRASSGDRTGAAFTMSRGAFKMSQSNIFFVHDKGDGNAAIGAAVHWAPLSSTSASTYTTLFTTGDATLNALAVVGATDKLVAVVGDTATDSQIDLTVWNTATASQAISAAILTTTLTAGLTGDTAGDQVAVLSTATSGGKDSMELAYIKVSSAALAVSKVYNANGTTATLVSPLVLMSGTATYCAVVRDVQSNAAVLVAQGATSSNRSNANCWVLDSTMTAADQVSSATTVCKLNEGRALQAFNSSGSQLLKDVVAVGHNKTAGPVVLHLVDDNTSTKECCRLHKFSGLLTLPVTYAAPNSAAPAPYTAASFVEPVGAKADMLIGELVRGFDVKAGAALVQRSSRIVMAYTGSAACVMKMGASAGSGGVAVVAKL